LAADFVRPRALIGVTLIGPSGTTIETAHLDPASDDCVFPTILATKLGFDLSNAPEGTAAGVGQVPATLHYVQATLRIANGSELCEWRAWIAFTEAPLNRPLLGFAGFLQYFTATFHGDREEVELTVNSLFPGAVSGGVRQREHATFQKRECHVRFVQDRRIWLERAKTAPRACPERSPPLPGTGSVSDYPLCSFPAFAS